MQYQRLGDTGLIVSRLAFGTMTLGLGKVDGGRQSVYKVDQAGANDLIGMALDRGVNFFNTADYYAGGASEEMLGEALGSRRSEAIVATKAGNRTAQGMLDTGLSRRHIIKSAEASLKRLNTDWIDLFLVHRADFQTPVEETLGALDQLIRSGKVRYVGFSNWPTWLAAKAVGIQKMRGYEPFRASEMYYSLVGRDLEHEHVPFMLDAGLGITVWSPLAGGFLSGKYTRDNPDGGGGGRLAGFDFVPIDRERGFDVVERLHAIARAHDAQPSQVALAWLLAKPAVASVLIGATSTAQLDVNLGAADIRLEPEELAELDALTTVAPQYPGWMIERTNDAMVDRALAARSNA